MSKVAVETLIERSERNMGSGIHPVVKVSAVELVKRAYNEGIYVQITSGFRGFVEQSALYAKGRTSPGSIVTNAKAGQSNHNYGLAIDYVLVSEDGTKAFWTVNEDWRRVAVIGKSLGFAWGGDWVSFKDYPHLEMMGGLSVRDLQAGKRPSLSVNFEGTAPAPKAEVKTEVVKPSAPVYDSVIGKGRNNRKSDVIALQKELHAKGFALPKYGADGDFGDESETAIKAFQRKVGIAIDGIAGSVTLAKLKAYRKPAEYPLPDGVFRMGGNNRTESVKQIQRALKVAHFDCGAVDGQYGANTADAVRRFQSMYADLADDGIFGNKTKTKLSGVLR